MSFVKVRLKELAADFGVTPKEISEIIGKFGEKPKSNSQVLTDQELNVVFEVMTRPTRSIPWSRSLPSRSPRPSQRRKARPSLPRRKPPRPKARQRRPDSRISLRPSSPPSPKSPRSRNGSGNAVW